MKRQRTVYIGISGSVLALDPRTGTEIWRTVLKKGHFISVVLVGNMLLATVAGEIYRLDPSDGTVLWKNPLKGLGHGFITVGGGDPLQVAVLKQQQDAAAAAAAATAAAT